MVGKVDPETLATVLARTGASNPSVLTGAAYGEDAAAIEIGDTTLVVSSDPISLAAEAAGTLGVHVACNDVAASGADPEYLTNVLFLPDEDPERLETLTEQLDRTAAETGVAIVGGHSEYVPALSRPLLSLTCLGTTDRFVPTGGVSPGDRILLTKGAGIEASAILATDFAAELADAGVPAALREAAAGYFDEVSVLPDSRALREFATAMHDPTEGGVLAGLVEMARASGVLLEVEREDVPVREPTAAACEAVGVDPLCAFGSGALLAAVPEADVDDALSALAGADVEGAVVGRATAGEPGVSLDGEFRDEAERDHLYPLWEAQEE